MAAICAETWEQINHRDLGVALARVRTALERHVRGERSVSEQPAAPEADDGGNRSALACNPLRRLSVVAVRARSPGPLRQRADADND